MVLTNESPTLKLVLVSRNRELTLGFECKCCVRMCTFAYSEIFIGLVALSESEIFIGLLRKPVPSHGLTLFMSEPNIDAPSRGLSVCLSRATIQTSVLVDSDLTDQSNGFDRSFILGSDGPARSSTLGPTGLVQ
ncbi:hypothetical protein FNV43_RR24894 [Rhamnella rubrinervis]|uniref:Uncharacterized protein n=1 Tax=Rhamnella rubrinervis TaxID=2594499 RepID=A0A8K0DNN4_9ROSA|nr:hypothetical protein FNV43_RR24894 [Rhamnella rubrinervis]